MKNKALRFSASLFPLFIFCSCSLMRENTMETDSDFSSSGQSGSERYFLIENIYLFGAWRNLEKKPTYLQVRHAHAGKISYSCYEKIELDSCSSYLIVDNLRNKGQFIYLNIENTLKAEDVESILLGCESHAMFDNIKVICCTLPINMNTSHSIGGQIDSILE